MKRPLSMAEQAMLYADRLRPGILSEKATLSLALRVRGPLDLDRLAAAYDLLVSRHEILRSRLIASERGEDYAEVQPHRPVVPDLLHADASLSEEALFAHWDELPIDPQRPPLVRCLVAPRQRGEHLIGLVVSHIIADPTALHLAVRDLADLYNAKQLPAPAQYSEYAVWEAERHKPRGERDLAAWKRVLRGVKPARYQRQVPFVVGRKPAPVICTLPVFTKPQSDAITRWSWRHRSTLSITLLAAFARAIRDDADRDDLVVSTVFERRDCPAAKDMLGNFLKAVPIRLQVADNESMPELVARARAAVLAAYERANMPLFEFVRLMPRFLPGGLGLTPTWFRFFQYVPTAPGAYRFGEARATIAHRGGRGDPDDSLGLHLGVFHADDGSLHARLNYDTHELDAESAHRVVDDFRDHTLEAIHGRW